MSSTDCQQFRTLLNINLSVLHILEKIKRGKKDIHHTEIEIHSQSHKYETNARNDRKGLAFLYSSW